jgi:ECF sigma factor
MSVPNHEQASSAPAPGKPVEKLVSKRLFVRLLGLVRKRLFSGIRSEKDVPVLGSILSSFFSNHVTDDVDLDDDESLWPILARIGLRHCNKHNKGLQREVCFKLTNSSLEAMRCAGVSEAFLAKLSSLKNQEYLRDHFSREIDKLCDQGERERYHELVMRHAERQYETPVVPIGAKSPDDSAQGFEPADDEPPPQAVVEFEEFLSRFKEQLTPRQTRIVELSLEGYSQSEIAKEKEIGVSPVTVSNEMKIIRAELETALDDVA